MTYVDTTPTRWRTISARDVSKPTWAVAYTTASGEQSVKVVDGMLIQADLDDSTNTRAIWGITDTRTGLLIPADELPGYLGMIGRDAWNLGHRVGLSRATAAGGGLS